MKKIKKINPEPICTRLKELRLALGFKTPESFRTKLGVGKTYYNYEKDRLPPAEFLWLLKNTFPRDVDLNFLFYGRSKRNGNDAEYRTNRDRRSAREYEASAWLAEIKNRDPQLFFQTIHELKGRCEGLVEFQRESNKKNK